jgi:hypothetical protein
MEETGVWYLCLLEDVHKGSKINGNRWVKAEKDDGRHRARNVAQGFSQVPGQDLLDFLYTLN